MPFFCHFFAIFLPPNESVNNHFAKWHFERMADECGGFFVGA